MVVMDFTTTAMARPDIVDQTYNSFSKNLTGIDLKKCRLFINIDPLPEGIDRKKVTWVAEKYFKEVCPNYPKTPNHTIACNWIWSQAETDYIFNLEDDWRLTKEVFVPDLLKYFQTHSKLMVVSLRAYSYTYDKYPLSPSIMYEQYYKAVAGKLDKRHNPEIQLRGKNFGIEMPAPSFNVSHKGKIIAHPNNKKKIVLKDIGRNWLKKSQYKRAGKSKKDTTTWERKK